MEGLTIVETVVLQELIAKIEVINERIQEMDQELRDSKKTYLNRKEVMKLTGFGHNWLDQNKADIGFTTVGSCLRFKRKDVEAYMDSNYLKTKSRRRK